MCLISYPNWEHTVVEMEHIVIIVQFFAQFVVPKTVRQHAMLLWVQSLVIGELMIIFCTCNENRLLTVATLK